ncbi:H/ACA ribonucleoprotein complex subunit 2-like protein [Pollicipes pollicipes]|uniref:H/ACA ribonucleoprotein complex subunit 2-like protein n=1 Tax=Pollicipes pollicipes TaxID=41117 RepID=UPI0018856B4E|nr:H/ACA ribonucleoprotein complex subunit 2-like protein [Pollicipes pollicipes]XP_037080992.1 H/ACA ribonucleoprotein complex subunit 2-like protein [Pollicipes pollicipes]XP_037080993.1 H/ACA ribonucleoprotein complex subunit 2-like protein [Pollicipes pollicipes]XP_037080994.1 H/ACA ribonucleoprotein complex subunit 2-like protein [Pollicipes pollicipes]XP_037080995.1 H/ACA ribonucleoprotein complex subunit 2-like protein [Pollicipes pollicipes]XP_037080996.1 H/ACA ribonucleoprotein comple
MGKKRSSISEAAEEGLDVSQAESGLSYDEKLKFVNRICKPMASKKLAKKLMKMIKKGNKHKGQVRNGLKDVQTRLRKGDTGIVVFAGDVTPEDIMCHLPAVCEEKSIPYVYVPCKEDIGAALGRKKGCIMALIQPHDDYTDAFQECSEEIHSLPIPV